VEAGLTECSNQGQTTFFPAMKHEATAQIEYRPARGVAGVETLSAKGLRTSFDRHFHDTYAFGLILRGVERCELRRAKRFFEPGTVPMFNPGEVHDGGPATEQGWSYRMVYLEPGLVGNERVFPHPQRSDVPATKAARRLFDAIDWGSELGIEEALAGALEILLGPADASAGSPALSKVRELIDARCCEPLRLHELSEVIGVSPTRLLRGFQAAYGLTPHRYQQSRRIAKARRMVLAGAPLAEVAAACGYADQSHLNRWFLRIQGTTPGRMRRAISS
jgi:AraC-like DNA-binding protein